MTPVRLTRIYTRSGDGGETSLADGKRVGKGEAIIEALGALDEANAAVGLAAALLAPPAAAPDGASSPACAAARSLVALLARIQNELFDLGADLLRPPADDESNALAGEEGAGEEGASEEGAGLEKSGAAKERLAIVAAQVRALEEEIDRRNAELEALDSFVLPGGTAPAAALHLARTTVRRAEREVARLRSGAAGRTGAVSLPWPVAEAAYRYLNRLSDLLFVLARAANRLGEGEEAGPGDVLWQPGATRPGL